MPGPHSRAKQSTRRDCVVTAVLVRGKTKKTKKKLKEFKNQPTNHENQTRPNTTQQTDGRYIPTTRTYVVDLSSSHLKDVGFLEGGEGAGTKVKERPRERQMSLYVYTTRHKNWRLGRRAIVFLFCVWDN